MSWPSSHMSWPSGASGGGANQTPHFKSHPDLNKLYNQNVVNVEKVERPVAGVAGKAGVSHTGVRVTTDTGDQFLVHNGRGYGQSSNTVVVPAEDMSSKWKVVESRPVSETKVHQYVKSGGKDYNLLTDNCHDSSKRMYNTGK